MRDDVQEHLLVRFLGGLLLAGRRGRAGGVGDSQAHAGPGRGREDGTAGGLEQPAARHRRSWGS
ncbi:hypothetical protein O1L55_16630 [Streptomyces albulus]|nr:hypothetical protein [Streptomyces noursei]